MGEKSRFWDFFWEKALDFYERLIIKKQVTCDSSELKFYAYDFDD
jgi:hypothetical protein